MTRKGNVALKKPNLISVVLAGSVGARALRQTYVSDGKNYFIYAEGNKQYMSNATPKNPTEFNGEWEGEVDSFFGGEIGRASCRERVCVPV